MFIVAALLLAFAFSDGRLPLAKMCCSRGKNTGQVCLRGQMISPISLQDG